MYKITKNIAELQEKEIDLSIRLFYIETFYGRFLHR